jgi:hypothetical protein
MSHMSNLDILKRRDLVDLKADRKTVEKLLTILPKPKKGTVKK